MRKILAFTVLCLLAARAVAQEPPSTGQLFSTQRQVRGHLSRYSYRRFLHMDTLDDAGTVTGSKEGTWLLFRYPARPPEVRRISLSGPGLRKVNFPRGEALRDALEGLPAFFSSRCGLRLVGADGALWKFRTWATEAASPEWPCFDGLVWVTGAGVAVKGEGRPSPAYRFYAGEEHRFPRGTYTMDPRGFLTRIEGEDILTFQTAFEGKANLRVRVRHLSVYSDYKTMHATEPVIVEQGDVKEEP